MSTIMVVEDSISMRGLIKQTLITAGHVVIEAADGLEALDRLGAGRIDLFLCDVNMPNLDGLGLVKRLRAMTVARFTPILMLTTEVDPAKKKVAKDAGATGWLVKPFQPEQLLATIQKVLS